MTAGYGGFQDNETFGSGYNSQHSVILSILSGVHTATLVKVVAVSNNGAVAPVGTVDVQPLVNQVDGNGNATPHGVIYACPYFRLQGGGNAIIIDPKIGDLGVALFAERDLSIVIAKKGVANPGSGRQFDMADALFIGGNLNGVPTQYIQFADSGVTIYSPENVTITASAQNVTINAGGAVNVNAGTTASIIAQDSITLQAPDIKLESTTTEISGSLTNNAIDVGNMHAHQVVGVQTGSSTIETSAPNA